MSGWQSGGRPSSAGGDTNPIHPATGVVYYRINYPTANIEQSQLLPDGTKMLYLGIVGLNGKMRVSFTSNGTTDGGNDYRTIYPGNAYERNLVNLVGKTLYFQVNKGGLEIEIEAWT